MSEHENITAKIVHILTIYPTLSPTMLQAGLGPQIAPKDWRPILESLVKSGKIKQEPLVAKSPSGRHITYIRLSIK